MLNHFETMQPIWDYGTERALRLQNLDPRSPFYGLVCQLNKGFAEYGDGVGWCYHFACPYYNPHSAYYHNPLLLERAGLALGTALAHLNADGTQNLRETNFHDSSSNGFAMQQLGRAWQLVRQFTAHTPAEERLEAKMREYTVRAGDAMVNCGFHTPNHRWVISSALALCYRLTGDPRYRAHIDRFLGEGIDCDGNGEYTERSSGVYNIICNRSLIIMAEELGMPGLLDHVTRNLTMVMQYFEPDRTLCTLNSTRQDFGKDPSYAVYYDNYLYMAVRTGNPVFAWMADRIQRENLGRWAADSDSASGENWMLTWFLREPDFVEKMRAQPIKEPPLAYETFFEPSGIVRRRRGNSTLTLIRGRPMFFKFQHGAQKVTARFAGSFFGTPHSQFIPQRIARRQDGGYRLEFHESCGYKRPFLEKPATSVWAEMDHSRRGEVCVQNFIVTIDVIPHGADEVELQIDAGGCPTIPFKLELLTEPGGRYLTEDTILRAREGDYVYLRRGGGRYVYGDYTMLTVEGGFASHWYGEEMRGAIPADRGAFTVAMTGETPARRCVRLRFGTYTGELDGAAPAPGKEA